MAGYIFAYALAAFLAYTLASPLGAVSNRRYALEVYALLLRRPWIIAKAILPLAGVVVALVLLLWLSTSIPWGGALRFSWLSLFTGGATGEAEPGGSAAGESPIPEGGTNIITIPLALPFVAPVFFTLLLAALPLLARAEERAFRRGTRGRLDALRRSLVFGLAHCLVGVPVFVGLALSVGGLYFSRQYTLGEREEPPQTLVRDGGRLEIGDGDRDGIVDMAEAGISDTPARTHGEGGGVGRATVHHTAYNLLVLALAGSAALASTVL